MEGPPPAGQVGAPPDPGRSDPRHRAFASIEEGCRVTGRVEVADLHSIDLAHATKLFRSRRVEKYRIERHRWPASRQAIRAISSWCIPTTGDGAWLSNVTPAPNGNGKAAHASTTRQFPGACRAPIQHPLPSEVAGPTLAMSWFPKSAHTRFPRVEIARILGPGKCAPVCSGPQWTCRWRDGPSAEVEGWFDEAECGSVGRCARRSDGADLGPCLTGRWRDRFLDDHESGEGWEASGLRECVVSHRDLVRRRRSQQSSTWRQRRNPRAVGQRAMEPGHRSGRRLVELPLVRLLSTRELVCRNRAGDRGPAALRSVEWFRVVGRARGRSDREPTELPEQRVVQLAVLLSGGRDAIRRPPSGRPSLSGQPPIRSCLHGGTPRIRDAPVR
jgi:hypothetical protein